MRDPNSRLTLIIPSFPDFVRSLDSSLRLPALETLLARGTRVESVPSTYEQHLYALFGCESEGELPLGAVRRIGDGAVADEGWWYCAAPVHFVADRDRVLLVAMDELRVSSEEASALVQSFNAHFRDDGWVIEDRHPDRWYLRAPGPQTVRTVSLEEAALRDLRNALPTGTGALRWHGFLNEIQMLFHGSEVNRRREQAGMPAINGLWIWGGGMAPDLMTSFSRVWSDDSLVRGLAKISGTPSGAEVEGLQLPLHGHGLAVLSPQAKLGWWEVMEQRWFSPALSALAEEQIGEVTIEALGHAHYRIVRGDLRRWWRRRRPLGGNS